MMQKMEIEVDSITENCVQLPKVLDFWSSYGVLKHVLEQPTLLRDGRCPITSECVRPPDTEFKGYSVFVGYPNPGARKHTGINRHAISKEPPAKGDIYCPRGYPADMAIAMVDGYFWHDHSWIQHDFIFRRTVEELRLVAFVAERGFETSNRCHSMNRWRWASLLMSTARFIDHQTSSNENGTIDCLVLYGVFICGYLVDIQMRHPWPHRNYIAWNEKAGLDAGIPRLLDKLEQIYTPRKHSMETCGE